MLRKTFVFPSFLNLDGLYYVKKDPQFSALPSHRQRFDFCTKKEEAFKPLLFSWD